MNTLLHPPLASIERKHLGLSDRLLEAMHKNALSAALREQVLAHSDWASYGNIKGDDEKQMETPTQAHTDISEKPIPPAIRDMIARRATTAKASFDPQPTAGQIIAIEQLDIPDDADFEGFLGAPLYVLLDAPHDDRPDIWHGWIAASETSYASYWDFLLQEQDQPFDPEVGMVQLWNPIVVCVNTTQRVMGQLTPARLQAVRSLATDLLTAPPSAAELAQPGRILVRTTTHGLPVVTGTPLGDEDDVRRAYQEILLQAAMPLRELAQLALQRGAVKISRQQWWKKCVENIRGTWKDFVFEAPLSVPMHTASHAEDLPDIVWIGRARVRLAKFNDVQNGTLEVYALDDARGIDIELWEDGTLSDAVTLPASTSCKISWENTTAELRLLHDGEVRILPLAMQGQM